MKINPDARWKKGGWINISYEFLLFWPWFIFFLYVASMGMQFWKKLSFSAGPDTGGSEKVEGLKDECALLILF